MADTQIGPTSPRWTHVALPCHDVDASIAFYTTYTSLKLLDRREDPDGQAAWLGHDDDPDSPFILVFVSFFKDQEKGPQPILSPFAHIGIEVPTRDEVDRLAAQAEADGFLHWPATEMPAPIGYICALLDPDRNVVEISHGQGVYAKAQEVWGSGAKTS